jgi:hypothetical protein
MYSELRRTQLLIFMVTSDAGNILCHNLRLNDGYTRVYMEAVSQCILRRATINGTQVHVILIDNN